MKCRDSVRTLSGQCPHIVHTLFEHCAEKNGIDKYSAKTHIQKILPIKVQISTLIKLTQEQTERQNIEFRVI